MLGLLFAPALQAQDDWTLKGPATKPSARTLHAMASLGGDQVLLFGGSSTDPFDDETWVYDLSDNTWTLKSPAAKPSARIGPAMAYLGGDQVLLFGGNTGSGQSDETWVYDLSDNTWTLKSPTTKPSVRAAHAMASLGGDQVLLFGGGIAFDLSDETWVYDLSDNTWTLKNPATQPSARQNLAMVSLGGDQVLLFGGRLEDFDPIDETWIYDLSDNTWTLQSPTTQPSARYAHAMASLDGDQVLLFGGTYNTFFDETWIYDLSDNTWTLKSPATQPSARVSHAMASLGGDQALLFGGEDADGFDDETWVYTVGSGTTLTINNVTQNELNSSTSSFTFTVSLSAPAGAGGVTFDIATADGTAQDDNPATEDNDYVGFSLTGQTILEGNSTKTISVTVNGDLTVEPDETFFVNLSNVVGATLGDGQGLGTITNDDVVSPEMDVQGNSISIADGDNSPATGDNTDFGSADVTSGTVSRSFTLHNTGAVDLNLTGTPNKVQISGAHAADFTVTLQPSSPVSSGTFTIFAIQFNPSGSGLRTATVSIDNNDSDEHPYNFAIQGTGTVACTPTSAPVFANCNTTTYLGCNPVTIPVADPSVTASDNCGAVTVLSSITNETNARVITYTATNSVDVATCTQIYTWSTAAPTIDTPPTAQTACVGSSASFSVVSNVPIPTFDYGLTYQWFKGATQLTNGGNISGATSANLTINPVAAGDAGSYHVVVNNACGSTPSDAVALTVCPELNIDDVTQNEGDGGTSLFTFTVSLTAPAGPGGVTFDIATANGTTDPATEPSDYTAKELFAQTIPEGSSTYMLSVTVNGDLDVEANETFLVNVLNVLNASTGDAQGKGTITNDDVAANNPPVNAVPGPQATNENTPLVFSSSNGNAISISDVDAGGAQVRVTLTATNGTLTLSVVTGLTFISGDGTADVTMSFIGTISDINAALNGLSFVPTTNFNGPASLQIVTNDLGNTGSGGPLSDDDTVNITVNAPPSQTSLVFLANHDVILDRFSPSEGNIHANNDVVFKKGNSTTYKGDLTAVDDISIGTKNKITGNLTAGDDIDVASGATIIGTQTEHATVAIEPLPSPAFSAGSINVSVPASGTSTLAPGSYKNVTVNKKGTLKLSSGDYFMNKLELKESAKLIIDVAAGPVNINVVEKLSFDKSVAVSITPLGEAGSDQVTFTQLDDDPVVIGQSAKVLGTIIAVEAEVRLSKSSRFKGAVIAENIVVESGAIFLPHGATTSLPKIAEFEAIEVAAANVITDYVLEQNYPNPFNPTTVISFQLPVTSEVTLVIYNTNGQLVKKLVAGEMNAGHHSLRWDATNDRGERVASGMYLYVLKAGEFTAQRKLVLMK